MRIKLISDLHFEFHRDGGKSFVETINSDCDALVIAGDLTSSAGIYDALSMFCDKFKNVLYVLGNHEFWNSSFDETIEAANDADAKLKNLHFLNNTSCVIDDKRFVGGTLWFPDNSLSSSLKYAWSDFLKIRDAKRIFYENNLTVDVFNRQVKKGDIVISHHLPSNMSVHRDYENEKSNCFFVCDMENLINNKEPAMWLHGHTHSSMDYTINATRVVCNPFGYAGYSLNKNYLDHLVLNV
jgi:Icc-related predicted phosphoesterase